MNHLTRAAVRILSLCALLGCALPAAAQFGFVSVPLDGQKTNVWCWAASGEMEMSYFGMNVQQCAEATYQFGQAAGKDCCNSPMPGVCISGGQVEIAHYGFTYQQLGGNSALTHAQIRDQISTRHEPWIINPYCADSSKCGSWGHVIVGVGYWAPFVPSIAYLDDFFFLFINDPWPPNVGSFYLQFYPAYKDGCWWGNGSCNGYAEGWDIYDVAPPKVVPAKFTALEAAFRIPPEEARLVLAGDPDPQKIAAASWRVVSAAITGDVARNLGFSSAAEARDSRITHAVEQFDVSLPRLRAFNAQTNAESMLERAPSLLVPVEVQGRVRATIRLRQEGKQWKLVAVGSPQFSSGWERARARGGQFMVFVEGLELAFAGKRVNGKVNLIPLFDVPMYGVKEGEELPAERVLGSLVRAAEEYRGNGATAANLQKRPSGR